VTAAVKFAPCADGALPELFMPSTVQWLSTTSGRVAPDGYSWMQAVHWVVSSGCYLPRRSHGPREMGRTTIRVAQELAQLSPCRPGVEYLARKLLLTERTVEYHLGMLREAGLLAYIERGTRVRGERARASEFALVIPQLFDACLGIRTAGDGVGRRVVGIAEAGRELMARMAAKASRKVRAARRKTASKGSRPVAAQACGSAAEGGESLVSQAVSDASADDSRCTPMEGGCCSCLSDGSLHLPPEAELASGNEDRTTGQKQQGSSGSGRRRLNRVGRRYQLAWQLIQQVPWMSRAVVPRIAWIVREVADAGWTVDEVRAWLDLRQDPEKVHRPSAFLATRLVGATDVWADVQARRRGVDAWRDNQRAAAARHVQWDGTWTGPRSEAVRREVAAVLSSPVHLPWDENAWVYHPGDQVLLEELSRQEVLQLRALAQANPDLVLMAIRSQGELFARRLYTHAVVEQVLRVQAQTSTWSSRMVVHGVGGQW
jgi:DNA-binding transcriptional ArsR family regulator